MKIRNGFVSNSSSSSFCIYGISKDIDKLTLNQDIDIPEDFKDEEGNIMMRDFLDELSCCSKDFGELGKMVDDLEFYFSEDAVYIGKSWSKIGDDETGKQFKETVKSKIKNLFNINVTHIETIKETIYNG